MNNLIKKISNLYNLAENYRYQVAFNLDVLACVFLNIIGLVVVFGPIAFGIILLSNSSVESIASIFRLDVLTLIITIGIPVNYMLASAFFWHNRHPISNALFIFGIGSFVVGVILCLLSFSYYVLELNYKFIFNPTEYWGVIVLDLIVGVICFVVYSLKNEQKVKDKINSILDKVFKRYNS